MDRHPSDWDRDPARTMTGPQPGHPRWRGARLRQPLAIEGGEVLPQQAGLRLRQVRAARPCLRALAEQRPMGINPAKRSRPTKARRIAGS